MTRPLPLPAGATVGIDVVDRTSRRILAGLPRSRTVDRVLGDAERHRVFASSEPATAFWMSWAAKEAAFKAVTLLRGAPPVFAHAAFEVHLEAGRVHYGELRARLTVNTTPDRIVAVVRFSEPTDPAPVWGAAAVDALHRGYDGAALDELRTQRFSPAEADAVRGLPSALARLAVRTEAASVLGVAETRLEVICPAGPAGRRPPYLHLDGTPVRDCGLSISHDQGWLAWAVSGHGQGIQGR